MEIIRTGAGDASAPSRRRTGGHRSAIYVSIGAYVLGDVFTMLLMLPVLLGA